MMVLPPFWSLIFLIFIGIIADSQTQFVERIKNKIRKVIAGKVGTTKKSYSYEEMILFPNTGFQRKDGNWRLNVYGWRFKRSSRNKFLGESSSTLGERIARLLATPEQIVYFNDTFQRDRLKPFMVKGKKDEEILIIIGKNNNFTTKTDSDGQFRTSFIMSDVDVQKLKSTSKKDQVITYKAVGDNADLWEGKIHLLQRYGLSIISDIDDTIKISEVLDKIRLAANTFIHSFRVVEDTRMHKINHLRYFIFNSLRKLVLIGDSGEQDPEIYAFVARKYPKRIHKIFIRAVKGETKNDKRFLKAFKDVPREKWLIFTDPINELPKDLNIK
ncbi:unnamed protein product [Rotaria sp. Silwood2]|nr:unnamed protein product [Rotaria sp. Silwood2]